MGYRVDPNAKNVWVRDIDDTEDLPLAVNASSVYFNSGKTMEQEFGKGAMSSNIATVDSGMEKVIDGTYDGAYESCKMYGKSLVNILTGEVESNLSQKYIDFPIVGVKANTTYMAIFNLETNAEFPKCGILLNKNTWNATSKPCNNKYNKILLTTTSDETVGLRIWYDDGATDRILEPTNVMLIEYQEGMENWDIPYFEGICDVKMPILRNVGRNLLRISDCNEFRMGATLISKTENSVTWRNPTAWGGPLFRLYLKPNTTYSYAFDKGATDIRGYVRYLENGGYTGGFGGNDQQTFTTRADGHVMFTIECSSVQDSVTVSNLIFVEEEVIPTFEPHKTNILETSNDIVLRGLPNGVKDSYDCLTGEYVQRVSGITLDGTQSVSMDGTLAYIHITDLVENNVSMSDALPSVRVNDVLEGVEGVAVQNRGNNSRIYININGLTTAEEITQRLQQKPVTIQYQLAEPIVTTIEPSTTSFAYENGHIILESGHEGQSLLPTLEYQTVVSRSGQVAMIDKTIQQHERKITLLEKMLVQNIIDIEYKNTLLALKLEIDEVI